MSTRWVGILFAIVLAPATARAAGGGDETLSVLLGLAVILCAAKVAGHLALVARQPPVLGELLVGILLGNLSLVGWGGLEPLERNPGIGLLAEIGVVLLLFEVGLESTIAEMRRVGLSSLLVAVLGVVTPFGLGWGVGALLLPQASVYVHVFLGATLTATSVGITARVLKDLGRISSGEARVILGAAVIDDVLGLVVLAAVVGLLRAADHGASVSTVSLVLIVGKALVFLVGGLALGVWVSPRWFRLATRLQAPGVLLPASLVVCFTFACLAGLVGLAPIVGAFAAGMLLERVHYQDLEVREERELERLLEPVVGLLAPVFFVVMGMRVDLGVFADWRASGLSGALTLAAILGKQACCLGVTDRRMDRLAVGLGMIPRGEVGLIFAGMGLGLTVRGEPVVGAETYAAVLVMVLVTTLVTPPLLRWRLG